MKICIAQTRPVKGNISANIESHLRIIDEAVKSKADIIAFPELSLTGYEPSLARELVLDKDDARLDAFQEISDKHQLRIMVGAPTLNGNNLHVSSIIFQPKKERLIYSKQHLFPSEKEIFTPGNNQVYLKIKGEIVAPTICYELSVPEHSKNAAANNASVYIAMVLNSVGGVDADIDKLSAIAKQCQMYVFMANYVGTSGGYECAGRSSAWHVDGKLAAQLSSEHEGILLYDTSDGSCSILNFKQ